MISNKTAKERFNRFLNTTIYEIEGFYRLSDRLSWAVLVYDHTDKIWKVGTFGAVDNGLELEPFETANQARQDFLNYCKLDLSVGS